MTQPTQRTYTLAFNVLDYDRWCSLEASPDNVAVTVTDASLREWLRLAQQVKAQRLACIERFEQPDDYICETETEEEPFRADLVRLVIDSDGINFAGEQRNNPAGTWESSQLTFDQLLKDFGMTVPELAPSEAMKLIQDALSGEEWDAETLDTIKGIMERSGYSIQDSDTYEVEG